MYLVVGRGFIVCRIYVINDFYLGKVRKECYRGCWFDRLYTWWRNELKIHNAWFCLSFDFHLKFFLCFLCLSL